MEFSACDSISVCERKRAKVYVEEMKISEAIGKHGPFGEFENLVAQKAVRPNKNNKKKKNGERDWVQIP